jgi:hypothetical protein
VRGGQEATGTPRVEHPERLLPASDAPNPDVTAPDEAPETGVSAVDATPFAHASEAEMARILDFYAVRWEYEPTTFPILWNLDGAVIESFAPDFYLPDLEVFLEMTTLKQRLVRKKNRKLRRLRELYPDIKIKLFYARDFRAMMLKYGRLGLAESLSGTPGQVVPDRSPIVGSDRSRAIDRTEPAALKVAAPPEIDDPIVAEPVLHPSAVAPEPGDAPVVSRAPRTRSSRRRRRAALPVQAGVDLEGGA